MSNTNRPRPLKLKKLPKGIFRWKVCFKIAPGHGLSYWDRYHDEDFTLPESVFTFLKDQCAGKYCLHELGSTKIKTRWDEPTYKKYDYLLFENQFDVTMFKLTHGYLIRRIYKIVLEGEE